MNEIARENRAESYRKRPIRSEQILIILSNHPEGLTARDVALHLHSSDPNKARPRLTEMEKSGHVEIVGKAYDMRTERNVSLYKITELGEEWLGRQKKKTAAATTV